MAASSCAPQQVPGTGVINHVHITDYFLEGEVPLAELCPLTNLVVSGRACGGWHAGWLVESMRLHWPCHARCPMRAVLLSRVTPARPLHRLPPAGV